MVQLICILLVSTGLNLQPSSSLLETRDLKEWRVDGKNSENHWSVVEGKIVGENENKAGSILWTRKEYTDFELELEYRTLTKDYDTGVFTRGSSHQVQIGISRSLKKDMTGCIYAPKDKQGSYPGKTDKVDKFHKVGEWNRLKVIVTGKKIQTILNDEPFVDYDAKTIPDKGPIGLQLHGGVHMKCEFRNIKLKSK